MDVQQAATLGIVAVAAVSVGSRFYKHLRGAGGCSGCGECGREPKANAGVRPAPKATPLVTLGVGASPRRADRNVLPK